MGHERLGLLPKSERWRDIVSDIALTATGECSTAELVEKTAQAIDARFQNLPYDPNIQRTLSFLVAVTVAARSESPADALADLGIDLGGKTATPLGLTQALTSYLQRDKGSLEYAELARSAAGRALTEFYQKETRQPEFLGGSDDPYSIWRRASNGGGFSELARQFFSHLTTSYLRYFIDREASAALPTVNARESFHSSLEAHVDRVTRHSFETAKIAQSFAAGWYNKNAKESLPSERKTRGFLSIALNKIRDSLGREVEQ